MALTFETVVKQLEDSGIVAAGKLENFIPPKAQPTSVEELVKELVKQHHLTKFQAQHINAGKTKSLILGGYTILDKIGAGGMGQVFKAVHRRMDRIVAIKMLPPAMTKDAAAAARFEREVRAAAKLSHSNIVAAYDADQANGVHFLVMEYVEGKDLSALVKKNGPFPVDKAVNYVLQAAKGLEFAHKKGVVHRDIKPGNLLLDSDGVVKILDMGLARIESDGPAQTELTGTGTIMGTVDYMSPEQALNTKHADHRADIYSLGCSLYYLLAGKAAYRGETAMEKLMAHQNQPIPSLADVQAEVPEQVEAVFKKMVAKKIEDRYQTMSEVVAELERCQSSSSSGPTNAFMSTSTANNEMSDLSIALASSPLRSLTQDEAAAAVPFHERRAARKKSAGSPPWKNRKVLIGAGAAGFLFVLLGVIVIIRNDKGEEIARVESAAGKSVEVRPAAGSNVMQDLPSDILQRQAGPQTKIDAPAFQSWMKFVGAMTAQQQLQAVSKKLVELNPKFDGKLTGPNGKGSPTLENGVVVQLGFYTFEVSDIAPVRVLSGLKSLDLIGYRAEGGGNGSLRDLSPLAGMSLTSLYCFGSRVTDLSPLQGMPLTKLTCNVCGISNLTPLAGMPLAELNISTTNVVDLSPLRGAKLTSLMCYGTKISDFAPLAGMPLKNLTANSLSVSDISPLAGMPLEYVWINRTNVADLSPLMRCPSLKLLKVSNPKVTPEQVAALQEAVPKCKVEWDNPVESGKPSPQVQAEGPTAEQFAYLDPAFQQWVKDVAALPAEQQVEAVSKKLMELNPGFGGKLSHPGDLLGDRPKIVGGVVTWLGFYSDHVADLSPVRALAGLTQLRVSAESGHVSALTDLAPLEGLPLSSLDLTSNSRLTDLSPLRGMKLTYFAASYTAVTDLSPLAGMPLERLLCGSGPLADLSPLRGMPLTYLTVNGTNVHDLSPLRGMPLKDFGGFATPISDITPLLDCPKLTSVLLKKTKVTAAQVAALQKALPNCKIDWDGPAEAPKLASVGFALEFDGVDDVVEVTSIGDNLAPPLTLEAWVTPASAAGGTLIVVGADNGPRFKIKRFGNTWHALVGSKSQRWADAPLAPGRRTHVAGVFTDRNQVTLFVDGVAMKTVDLEPGAATQGISGQLRIGFARGSGNSPAPFAGLVDQVRVSNSARYTANFTPPPLLAADAATLALYRFEEGSGDILHDSSGKNHHGNITGAKWVSIPTALLPGLGANTTLVTKLAYLDPAFQQWVAATQKLPAEQQLAAVSKKLMELNPGFDGKLTGAEGKGSPKIEGGVVTELGIATDQVTDIAPVRALVELKTLACAGSDIGKGRLSDLSPLQGMKLTTLSCSITQIQVLSPLQGMNLTVLRCGATQVTDLSLLKRMPLTLLWCSSTRVSDLSPLAGMPLTNLSIHDTPVSDLSPLQGMPLKSLNCYKNRVFDLSPLAGMKMSDVLLTPKNITKGWDVLRQMKSLDFIGSNDSRFRSADFWHKYDAGEFGKPVTNLDDPAFQQWVAVTQKLPTEKQIEAVSKKLMELNPGFDGKVTGWDGKGTPKIADGVVTELRFFTHNVTDISPVRGLAGLKSLACGGNSRGKGKLSDLSPLEGMSLMRLDCGFTSVFDLSPLRGMPLTSLGCMYTTVSDLSPLQGMKLTELRCEGTQATDLSALRGMPLTLLTCYAMKMSDLSPLQGMKLTNLDCSNTQVSDLSPLKDMKLTYLSCIKTPVSDLSPLTSVPTLGVLKVQGTKVTSASVIALQKALPNCKIEWDDPAKPKTPEPAASGTK